MQKTAPVFACVYSVAATAVLLAATPALGQAASFFDPFDRIDNSRWYISDGWVNGNWHGCTWAKSNLVIRNGILQMKLTKAPNPLRAYKCAEIRTHGSHGYGLYEVSMRTAAGAGLNTAMFTYSGRPLTPIHDEIDFEFLGKSPRDVQLNYYVAGRGGHESIASVGSNASAAFHTYAFEWTPTALTWYIDGRLVRRVTAAPRPTTPGQFFLTLWNGTDKNSNWLGTFVPSTAPVTAEVDWVAFTAPGERCRFQQSISCKRR
ncbi:family 16 glycosylhydrolase [Polymorphobacter fuscus]|nr:family 16 glycosylhydrolase [Polymorphobacter fuscus]NJC08771.1 endo-1,3-1,4-beta-glycanase ExoK [Polymorphobacter fuscus]